MEREPSGSAVLVTGAAGQIGRELCRQLQASGASIVATDHEPGGEVPVIICDLTSQHEVSQLFHSRPITAVVHLAGILPSAFLADPLRGIEVNLTASCRLLRQAIQQRVKRFVFASSMSVYGLAPRPQPVGEEDPRAPQDPYAACKCAVESAGAALRRKGELDFVALRIARVVGPGAKNASSPWRSQMFEPVRAGEPISIPFAPETLLSLVHVQEVARMLVMLLGAVRLRHTIYNAPAEAWTAKHLRDMTEEARGTRVVLGNNGSAGPACDGRRFAAEFKFRLCGLLEYLPGARPVKGPENRL